MLRIQKTQQKLATACICCVFSQTTPFVLSTDYIRRMHRSAGNNQSLPTDAKIRRTTGKVHGVPTVDGTGSGGVRNCGGGQREPLVYARQSFWQRAACAGVKVGQQVSPHCTALAGFPVQSSVDHGTGFSSSRLCTLHTLYFNAVVDIRCETARGQEPKA